MGATITGEITVSQDSIIRAITVITKEIPLNSVVIYNPGELIKQNHPTGNF